MTFDFFGSQLVQGSKAVATPGTPVQLAAAGAYPQVFSLTIKARKPSTRGVNTGDVYVGVSGAAGTQTFALSPSESVTLTAPHLHQLDLSKVYVDAANAADGVVFIGQSQSSG